MVLVFILEWVNTMAKIKNKITTEQEYIGLCYGIREDARRLLDSVEHSIILYENKDGVFDGYVLGENGEQIIAKMMKEWIKWKMRDAMRIVHGIRNFAINHLKDDIDIYTQLYYSEEKQQSAIIKRKLRNQKNGMTTTILNESKKSRKREQEKKV
jgi:hypothetical protein